MNLGETVTCCDLEGSGWLCSLKCVFPSFCIGAVAPKEGIAGASGALVLTEVCAGVCPSAGCSPVSRLFPVVAVRDLVQGCGVEWVGEQISSAGSGGSWCAVGVPAAPLLLEGLGCLRAAPTVAATTPSGPHPGPLGHPCGPRLSLLPGPGCPRNTAEVWRGVHGVSPHSDWGAWQAQSH